MLTATPQPASCAASATTSMYSSAPPRVVVGEKISSRGRVKSLGRARGHTAVSERQDAPNVEVVERVGQRRQLAEDAASRVALGRAPVVGVPDRPGRGAGEVGERREVAVPWFHPLDIEAGAGE